MVCGGVGCDIGNKYVNTLFLTLIYLLPRWCENNERGERR